MAKIKLRKEARCKVCNVSFFVCKSSKGLFCDQRCANWYRRKRVFLTCLFCNKKFERKQCAQQRKKNKKKNFCSRECDSKFRVKANIRKNKKTVDNILLLRKAGLSFRKIAKELKTSNSRVISLYNKNFPE